MEDFRVHLQICRDGILIGEVICMWSMYRSLWAKYVTNCVNKGIDPGMSTAGRTRFWKVAVGQSVLRTN